MTNAELVARSIEFLGNDAVDNQWFTKQGTVYAAISAGLQELARTVAASNDNRHLLQTEYTLTVEAGKVDLYDSAKVSDLSTYSPPLAEAIAHSTLIDSAGSRYTYLRQYQDILLGQPTVFGYYNLSGQRLKFRKVDSGDTNFDETFTLIANFVPTAEQVPTELEDDAVAALVRVIRNS